MLINDMNKIYASFILLLIISCPKINAQVCVPSNYNGFSKQNYLMGLRNLSVNNLRLFDSTQYSTSSIYTDAYDSVAASLGAGRTCTLKLNTRAYPQTIRMWVDYNKNDSFENSEVVYFKKEVSPGNVTFNYTPTVCNDSFRVRLLVDYPYYYNGTGADVDPCKVYYGDVFDFKIVVSTVQSTDVGIHGINSSSILSSGNNALSFKFKNYGNASIDSVRAYYQINGGAIITENITGLQLSSCATYDYTFTDSFVATDGAYDIKTWVKYPNGIDPDATITNDTFIQKACIALNGYYTINGAQASSGKNFKTFTDAVSILNSCGITGPVVFTVAAGIYKDSVQINNIPGSSATNTITFNGVDTTTRSIMAYNSDIVHLNEAKYITFKNLSFRVGSNITNGISINGNSEYIIIDSCNFTTTKSGVAGIITTPSSNLTGIITANYITLSNNTIANFGGYGIFLIGSYTQNAYGNKVHNNFIKNCVTGFRGHYQDSLDFYKNNVKDCGSEGATFFVMNNIVVYQNYIIGKGSAMIFTGVTKAQAANNMLSAENASTLSLQIYKTRNSTFYHNSMLNAGNYSKNTYIGLCSKVDFRNNTMANMGNSAYLLYVENDTEIQHLDYNQYYNLGNSNRYVYIGKDYFDINSLRGKLGMNNYSSGTNPNFTKTTSPPDLHIKSTSAPAYGDASVGIAKDIDNNTRCAIAPTVGADESNFQQNAITSNFASPDTSYIQSPVSFINKGNLMQGKKFEWYIDTISAPSSVLENLVYSFTSVGTYNVKLKTYNCLYSHDTTKQIVIVYPTLAPVSNFKADTTEIDSGEFIQLYDLSTGGATSWAWSISGGANQGLGIDYEYLNGTDSFSQHPIIKFLTQGQYDICLTTNNQAGSHQLCKAGYIKVFSPTLMCQASLVTAMEGHFYDDGGKNNYTSIFSNINCALRISPCGGPISLAFRRVDFDTAFAMIKIYDGVSAAGKLLNKFSVKTGFVYTAASGNMYIEWTSPFGNSPGWEASWKTAPKYIHKIPATITAKDTGYVNTPHHFSPKYYQDRMEFSWDFNNDGVVDTLGRFANYTFQATGNYKVTCYATSCGGMDTGYIYIHIINPGSLPNPVDIIIDPSGGVACQIKVMNVYTLQAGRAALLMDKTGNGPTSWEWNLVNTNLSHSWDNGNNLQNPSLTIYDTGMFSLELKVTNAQGTSTKTFNNILHVTPAPCVPATNSSTYDYGISKLTFNDITHKSKPTNQYEDNTYLYSTCVEIGKKYYLSIARQQYVYNCRMGVWIDYNQDGTFSSAELVSNSGLFTTLIYTDSIKIPTLSSKVLLGRTTMRVGLISSANALSPCGVNGSGEYEDYTIIITKDITPPIITLIGGDTAITERGLTYHDAGAKAVDAVDGVVPYYYSSQINTMIDGYYTAQFDAEDKAGNVSLPTFRTVHVTGDHTPPVITINGSNPYIHFKSNRYIDQGATAYDSAEGFVNVVVVSNTVLDSLIGSYYVKYKATDSKGNSDSATRTVIVSSVIDSVAPIISLIGNDTIYIEVRSAYNELGINISDNYDTAPTYSISGGPVNTNYIDTFILVYTGRDYSGNTSTLTRTVIIQKTSKPSIILIGKDTVELWVQQTYADEGVSLIDSYYSDSTLRPLMTTGTNFNNPANAPGIYTSWFHVVDPSGNASDTVYRYISVSINGVQNIYRSVIEIFPNPTNDCLHVSGMKEGIKEIRVLGMDGRMLYTSQTISSNIVINTSNLSSGLYILQVQHANQYTVEKFEVLK
jgi:PKD repeat protein